MTAIGQRSIRRRRTRPAAATRHRTTTRRRPQRNCCPSGARACFGGLVLPVRELWGLRVEAAFPSAETATRAIVDILERPWGDREELCGPPVEMRVQTRGDFRMVTQSPSGLAAIVRHPFDGWEEQPIMGLRANAWQVQASLDECLVVKALRKSSNHAKEFNWLGMAVESFVKEGGCLNVALHELKMGYSVLRNTFARDTTGKL